MRKEKQLLAETSPGSRDIGREGDGSATRNALGEAI